MSPLRLTMEKFVRRNRNFMSLGSLMYNIERCVKERKATREKRERVERSPKYENMANITLQEPETSAFAATVYRINLPLLV